MKNLKIRCKALSLITGLLLIASGCSTTAPVMQLSHNAETVGETYSNQGKIKVLKFIDDRPAEEYGEGRVNKSIFAKRIGTGNTSPLMDEYLKTVIEDEIRESGLFRISNGADYTLSGTIKSIKNVHEAGGGKKVSLTVMLASSVVSAATGTIVLGLVPIGVLTVVYIVSKDKIQSIVSYEFTLSKNGEKILQDEIDVSVNHKLPLMKDELGKSSRILDQTVTLAVREMLQKIDHEFKTDISEKK